MLSILILSILTRGEVVIFVGACLHGCGERIPVLGDYERQIVKYKYTNMWQSDLDSIHN